MIKNNCIDVVYKRIRVRGDSIQKKIHGERIHKIYILTIFLSCELSQNGRLCNTPVVMFLGVL